MAERDTQDFIPQEVPDASRVGDSQPQSPSLWDGLILLPDQAITHVGIPDAMHSDALWRALTYEITQLGQVPEAAPQMTLVPDWSDKIGFADGQVCTNGSRLDSHLTDQSHDFQHCNGVNPLGQSLGSPFTQGNGVQFPFLILSCNASHDQSSYVPSLQHSEYTQGVPLISPFQHHATPITEVLEFTGPRRSPERKRAKRSNQGGRYSEEWLCRYGDCDKKYRRFQDQRRHIRDKHQTPHKCPFCDTKWTRPEKIREHLIIKHQDQFVVEELQEIRRLRGRNDTIRFVTKCGVSKFPSSGISGVSGA